MTPRLEDVLAQIITGVMRKLRVSEPAEVLAYDAEKQRATVQPLIHRGRYDEDGIRQTKRPEAITNVPVVFMSNRDGFRFTMPLAKGDTVLLVYCDSSLDQWLLRGGEVDPQDDRTHRPDDAIAFASVRDFAHPIEGVGDNPAIGYEDALLEFTDTQIRAGGTSALALHAKLEILWNHVNGLFTGGTGSAVVPIVGSLGSGTSTLKGA